MRFTSKCILYIPTAVFWASGSVSMWWVEPWFSAATPQLLLRYCFLSYDVMANGQPLEPALGGLKYACVAPSVLLWFCGKQSKRLAILTIIGYHSDFTNTTAPSSDSKFPFSTTEVPIHE
jgi:hypothetical protein